MQKRILAATALLILSAASVLAQGFPQRLPPATVYGRMPGTTGPGQAIPFATLGAQISVSATNASNISSGVLGAAFGGAGATNGIMQANGAGAVSAVTIGDKLNYAAGILNIAPTANFVTIGATSIGLGQTVTTITGLAAPTAASDAATKAYVDANATGLHILTPVKYGTTGALANTPTYDNGAAGVGATLTAGSNGAISIDGATPSVADRVLVKDQASALQNGIYTVTTVGSGGAAYVLTRATDFDTAAEMLLGSFTLITAGAINTSSSYVLQSTVTTVGTTAAVFLQFGAAGSTQWTTSASDIYYNVGKVGVGSSAVPSSLLTVSGNGTALPTPPTGTRMQVASANGASTGLTVESFGTNTLPFITMRRANGTAASPTASQSNDVLGAVDFVGYGASGYASSQRMGIFGRAAENWTDSAQGGHITVVTTPTGSITPAERMRIAADGSVGIGTTTPTDKLNVGTGNVRFNSYASRGRLSTSSTGLLIGTAECKPIEVYGGAASNSWAAGTDNVAAWNAFLAAVGTDNACLEFGPGIYRFESAVSVTLQGSTSVQPLGQGLTIRGSGMGSSFLYFPNNTNGMGITYTEAVTVSASTFNAMNLSFATCAPAGNSAYGLQILGNSTSGNVPKTTILQNLTFQPAPPCSGEGGSYWGTGINLINAQNVDYDHISVWGANQGWAGVGISLDGGSAGGSSTSHRFSHLRMFFIATGINITGHAEGISSQHHDFVHVERCFRADVFSGAAQSPEYRFINGECAARTIGVEWNGVAYGFVTGNLFYNGAATVTDATAVALTNTTNVKIHDNQIDGGVGATNRYGVTVDSGSNFTKIHDNSFANQSNAVWLKAGTNYGIVQNNIIVNGNACTNSASNSTLTGNVLVTGVVGSC